MCYHNHRLIFTFAEGFDHLFDPTTIVSIQSMKRLVQNQQFRIFDESTCQQSQTLLPTGKLQERFVFQVGNAEYIHPPLTYSHLLRLGTFVQSDTVVQSAGYDFNSRQVFEISTMHLRTYISDVFLDFPNTFSSSPFASEKADVASV